MRRLYYSTILVHALCFWLLLTLGLLVLLVLLILTCQLLLQLLLLYVLLLYLLLKLQHARILAPILATFLLSSSVLSHLIPHGKCTHRHKCKIFLLRFVRW